LTRSLSPRLASQAPKVRRIKADVVDGVFMASIEVGYKITRLNIIPSRYRSDIKK
jgi:hypothetical protein